MVFLFGCEQSSSKKVYKIPGHRLVTFCLCVLIFAVGCSQAILPQTTSIPDAYANGSSDEQVLLLMTLDFLVNYLAVYLAVD